MTRARLIIVLDLLALAALALALAAIITRPAQSVPMEIEQQK